jgi:hypothetical protein
MEQIIDFIYENINIDQVKKEIEDTVEMREKRNIGEAGVPVYLILDDLTEESPEPIKSGDSMFNILLAISAIQYIDYLVEDKKDVNADKVSQVLGALAEKYFYFLSYKTWE